tara:strand:+ start:3586 stop:3975 length:390 start_codon:yes stop_codon:yes gene_type:complete
MDKKKVKEIKKLFQECKELKNEVYTCHDELKTNYSVYKKQILSKMNKKSENTITDLKMVLAYLKKHNELKMIYDSYKELLREMLQYKKKIVYFSHLSKPLISDKQLQILLKEQNDIIESVGKIDDILPN